jgi:hypothetical protein
MADTLPPFPPEPPSTPPPSPPPVEPLPWEQPGFPFLEGIFETAKLILTKPGEAFSRMSTSGDLGRPIFYAIVFGWIGIVASQIYNIALRGAMMNFMPMMREGGFAMPTAWSVGMMVLAPIFVLIGVFVWSAIIHLFLMLAGGPNAGFGATVRVVCYASTVQVLNVIPFCGGLIATVWAVVLQIIGLAAAHRTSQGKSALAVLLPLVLCCACAVVVMVAFGTAVWALFSNLR